LTPFSLYLLFVETCLERWTMESAGRGFDSRVLVGDERLIEE